MASPTFRNLYRLAAVVDERILHQLLVLLAANKAMDVHVLPVTSGGDDMPEPPQRVRTSNGNRINTATQMIRLFAAQASAPFRTADVMAAAPDDIPRHHFAVQLAHLAKKGELKRVSQGLYERTAKLKAASADGEAVKSNGAHPATNGATPPATALPRTPSGRLQEGAGPALLVDLLRRAPGPLKSKDLYAAMRENGVPAKSINGILARSKAKLKKTKAGYELRAGA